MNSTIKATLKNTISTLENKSRETSEADFSVKTASDKAAAAQKKISTMQAKVEANEMKLDDINAQISDPPTTEVASGKKNEEQNTIVDQKELAKLNSEKRNITTLISQARTDVESAREEAESSSTEALKAAGIKQEIIQESSDLKAKISNIQDTLRDGGKVSDEELNKLATDVNKLASKFNGNDNKGDILGNTIYDPIAKGLKDIIKALDKSNSPQDPNVPPPVGTINRKLFDIGIKGEPQTKITSFMEKIASNNTQMNSGKTFTKDEVRALHTEYKGVTTGLTDTQKNSDVIKGFKTDMEAFVNRSGHGDILTESGG